MATLTRETTSFKSRAEQQHATFVSCSTGLEEVYAAGLVPDSKYQEIKSSLEGVGSMINDMLDTAKYVDMLSPEEFDALAADAEDTFTVIATALSVAVPWSDPQSIIEEAGGFDEE